MINILPLLSSLVKEMTEGKFSEDWTLVAKTAIAEAVLNLTRNETIAVQ